MQEMLQGAKDKYKFLEEEIRIQQAKKAKSQAGIEGKRMEHAGILGTSSKQRSKENFGKNFAASIN